MTVSTDPIIAQATGPAAQYPYSFLLYAETDMQVIVSTPSGSGYSDTVLTYPTSYSVVMNSNFEGGYVVLKNAVGASDIVTLKSNAPYAQNTSISDAGNFRASVVEKALDYLAVLIKQINYALNNTLSLPAAAAGARNGMVAGWDATTGVFGAYAFNTLSGSPLANTAIGRAILSAADAATIKASAILGIAQDFQNQSFNYFTAGGSAPAFTLTPSPAISAYQAGQRFRVKFTADGTTGSNQINISGQGAKNIKQYDAYGNKQPAVIYGTTYSTISELQYDGTDFILLNPFPVLNPPKVRQTVASAPLTSGLPDYLQYSSLTVSFKSSISSTYPLVISAANGFGSGADRVAIFTSNSGLPSWTISSTTGTYYLYVTVNSDGSISADSTALAPVYQSYASPATTSGQFTFNTTEMRGYLGNGTTAPQSYSVVVGECTVSGGVITSLTHYALNGQYDSNWIATLPITPAGQITKNHNIGVGVGMVSSKIKIYCNAVSDSGYSNTLFEAVDPYFFAAAGAYAPFTLAHTAKTVGFSILAANCWAVQNKTTGAVAAVVANTNWNYRITSQRDW